MYFFLLLNISIEGLWWDYWTDITQFLTGHLNNKLGRNRISKYYGDTEKNIVIFQTHTKHSWNFSTYKTVRKSPYTFCRNYLYTVYFFQICKSFYAIDRFCTYLQSVFLPSNVVVLKSHRPSGRFVQVLLCHVWKDFRKIWQKCSVH